MRVNHVKTKQNPKPIVMIINALYHQAPDAIQSEFDWIEQAKLDPQKFGRLYNKYYDQIYRYVNQRVECVDLAADVTSQVFFKAFCNLHKYQWVSLLDLGCIVLPKVRFIKLFEIKTNNRLPTLIRLILPLFLIHTMRKIVKKTSKDFNCV